MFWRFNEDDHPANRGDVTPEMREVIDDHYRWCDRLIGEVMRYVDESTLAIALSDHGMNTFRRGVHLNSWLHDHGLLAFKPGIDQDERSADFFRGVDWTRTRAYALGLGGIYLNMQGRETHGTVHPEDAPALTAQLVERLSGLTDPERSQIAIRNVATREQLYAGPYAAESPDLLANFAPGYRASWATTLGGTPQGLFEDNTRKWGGDHIIDPRLVPGVLFMNRPFDTAGPSLLDMAPTILGAFGLPKGQPMEGRSLLP
jgi:predicted AlkP superfamily phosphohydrolase/phosphomutase